MDVWLSLFGPKLEAGTEIGSIICQPSPGHLGLMVAEVIGWLPGLLLEMTVWLRLASWPGYCRKGISWAVVSGCGSEFYFYI